MGEIFRFFKKYWYHSVFAALLAILTFLQLVTNILPLWSLYLLVLAYAGIAVYKDVISELKEDNLNETLLRLLASNKDKDELIKSVDAKLDVTKASMEQFLAKKQGSIDLLNQLINKGLIDEEDINKYLESSELTCLFCYATAFPKIKENKNILKLPRRFYPGFLEQNLGFIRMGKRASFFVILTKNLPKELQYTINLKRYLLKKFDNLFKEEYKIFIDELEKENFKRNLKKYKDVSYKDLLKMSILIVKGKLSENNVGFLHEQTFYRKFLDLVKSEIDLKKIHLPQIKKIKVKNYVLASSCEILLPELSKEDLDKLKSLEPDLKNTLSIEKVTDYSSKNEDDIKNSLLKHFPEEKASIYAKGIKTRANDYEKALIDLSISLD